MNVDKYEAARNRGDADDARGDAAEAHHAPLLERIAAAETKLEDQYDARILFTCEAGSRAWGFPSPDSDYDVRFIYARDPKWYMRFDIEHFISGSVDYYRDVIEPGTDSDLDMSGWDLRKALYLFTRTNGALLEWLMSPTVYTEVGEFAERLRALIPQSFNRLALCYHYSHMARRNAREYIYSNQVRLKKYLYVLRPLLAIRYIERTGGVPPVDFQTLVDVEAPAVIWDELAALLEMKAITPELGKGAPFLTLNAFIDTELQRHGDGFKGQGRPDLMDSIERRADLNQLFQDVVWDRV